MSSLATGALGFAVFACAAAHAQNTAPRATPQTQQSAPASTGAATQSAQQAESDAAHGSSGGNAQGGRKPGITGVAASRSGVRARRGSPAPKANAKITIIGGTGSASSLKTQLPGMPPMRNALGIAAGTPLRVRLLQSIDSGTAKNGDKVRGVLAAPVAQVSEGAPVELTVVSSAAAGRIGSAGELSLQVVSINGEPILSEVITAEGKEGAKILPDDAPARGTEAVFTSDQPITVPAAS